MWRTLGVWPRSGASSASGLSSSAIPPRRDGASAMATLNMTGTTAWTQPAPLWAGEIVFWACSIRHINRPSLRCFTRCSQACKSIFANLPSSMLARARAGIELLPELNRVAQENIRKYKSDAQRCFKVESVCANASSFIFPAEPTVIYLFNPLPESGLVKMLRNLERSEGRHSIPMYLIYHNPLLHESLAQFGFHTLVTTDRYVVLHI